MKKILIIILAAVLVISGGITFGVIYNQPEYVAARSISDVFEDALTRDASSAVNSVFNGGSVKFNVNEITKLAEYEDEDDYVIFGNRSEEISGKLYVDSDELYLKDFILNYGDLDIEGEAYISNDLVYVKENNLFDYDLGIKLSELAEQIEDSIFAYDDKSDYSLSYFMDEDEYEEFLESLKLDDTKKMSDDLTSLTSHIVERAWKIIMAHAEFESETLEITVGGYRKTARVITVSADSDDINAMLDEFCTTVLANDEKIAKFIKKYDDVLMSALSIDTEKYSSAYAYYRDIVEELRVKLSDYELGFDEIEVTVATPRLSSELLKLSVALKYDYPYYDESYSEEILLLDFGPDGIDESKDIRITVGDYDIRYMVGIDDKTEYSSNLYVEGEKVLSFYRNKTTDKFSLSLYEEDYDYWYGDCVKEYKLLGSLEELSSGYKIKATRFIENELTSDRQEIIDSDEYKLDIQIVTSSTDKVPAAPKSYNTIDDVTEKDVEAWLEELYAE